jgi:hypothetical protein
MKRCAVLSLFFAVILPVALQAEDVKLFIVYAEGKGFMLVRGGKSQYVDFASQAPVGMELKAGDTVNVEPRSSIEIQLYPTTNVMKALASSSFTVKAVYANGNCDLDIAFGRLRTKTDDRIANGDFFYNGVEIAATAGGTDFGYDLIFSAGRQLSPVISCFSGAIQVTKTSAASLAAGNLGAASLAGLEMLSLGDGVRATLDKKKLAADLDGFWQKNDFKTRPSRRVATTTPDATLLAKNDTTPSPSPVKNDLLTPPPSPTATPTPSTSPSPAPTQAPTDTLTGSLAHACSVTHTRRRLRGQGTLQKRRRHTAAG